MSATKVLPNRSRVERPSASQACGAREPDQVEGMNCANCALTINKYLQKQGAQQITVNPIDGDVSFEAEAPDTAQLARGVESLGYRVEAGGRAMTLSVAALNC